MITPSAMRPTAAACSGRADAEADRDGHARPRRGPPRPARRAAPGARRARRWCGCPRRRRRSPRAARADLRRGVRGGGRGDQRHEGEPGRGERLAHGARLLQRQVGDDRPAGAGVGERARELDRHRGRAPCSRNTSATTATRSDTRRRCAARRRDRRRRRGRGSRRRGSRGRRRAGPRRARRARRGRRRRRAYAAATAVAVAVVGKAAHQIGHQGGAALRAGGFEAGGDPRFPGRGRGAGSAIQLGEQRHDLGHVLVAAAAETQHVESRRRGGLVRQEPGDGVGGLERGDDALEAGELAERARPRRRRSPRRTARGRSRADERARGRRPG